jgi:hypothetical protein
MARRRKAPPLAAHDAGECEHDEITVMPAQPTVVQQGVSTAWVGVAVGASVIALMGIVGIVTYLLTRRKDGNVLSGIAPQLALPATGQSAGSSSGGAPNIYVINTGSGSGKRRRRSVVATNDATGFHELTDAGISIEAPIQNQQPTTAESVQRIDAGITDIASRFTKPPEQPIMNTIRLPSFTDPKSQAVRLMQALSTPFDGVLRVVGPAGSYAAFSVDPNDLNVLLPAGAVPTGSTLIVASGHMHPLRLNPRQAVFAKGSAVGVYVSVNAGEAGGRVYG